MRHYDAYDAEEEGDGEPVHPAEAGYLLPRQDGFPDDAFDGVNPSDSEAFTARYHQVKEGLRIPDTCYAHDIAARVSVDPGALGPHTSTSAHGVVALTACGREHGHPAGGAARVMLSPGLPSDGGLPIPTPATSPHPDPVHEDARTRHHPYAIH
ncbi:hypothetical protein ACF064_27790 [Streptomyces sp. NPDC015492]|uniref:hypothetical protein n=1 Tax=Streptomyces sp. NPDC015492 TaxID=3364958 RepID=UPI0036F9D7C9